MSKINLISRNLRRQRRPIDEGVAAFAGICIGSLLGAAIWVIIALAVWALTQAFYGGVR